MFTQSQFRNLIEFPAELPHRVEVVGLSKSDLGRSCANHECCGETVKCSDSLYVRYQILNIGKLILFYMLHVRVESWKNYKQIKNHKL